MLLGSGELGRELAFSFKRLGKTVIACDNYPQAPAMQVADQAQVLDLSDPQALKLCIEQTHPDLIISEVEKVAAPILVQIAASGLARVTPSAQAIATTFNRRSLRELASAHQIPTSDFRFAASAEELAAAAAEIGFPCFVKPTASSSGHGQSFLTSPQQVTEAWEKAISGARGESTEVIVEAKVDFDFEITLLTVNSLDPDGQVQLSFCQPIGHRQENGDYVESWQPQPLSESVLQQAQLTAKKIIEALAALDSTQPLLGLFGVELFIRDQEVIFSEIAPRPHDTGLVTLLSQQQSEFDLYARAVLGLPVNTALTTPGASAVIKASAKQSPPILGGLAHGLRHAEQIILFNKPAAYPGRRLGVTLASGPTVQTAREKAGRAAEEIKQVFPKT